MVGNSGTPDMELDGTTTPGGRGPKLFYCSAPNCSKFFNRKEHLTRHVKSSHSTQPQYECPICGRRYARSDVLKRHVEHHPQNPHPRQPAPAARPSEPLGDAALTISPASMSDTTSPGSSIGMNVGMDMGLGVGADTTPASSTPSFVAAVPGLDLQVLHDSHAMHRLVRTFFAEIHPYWPILHEPTFDIEKCSPLLLQSIILLASLIEGGNEYLSMGPVVLSSVFASQLIGDELHVPIQTLQAMLLCVVFCITKAACRTMRFRALCLNGYLIAACRHQQIFNGQGEPPELADGRSGDVLAAWLAQEQRNRLAYACLRMDAYLSILLDHPPSIRYFELGIPLPKLTSLWNAVSDDERSRLQWSSPAGRERALFCNILRDALEEETMTGTGPRRRRPLLPLTKLDYHLGLCALQGGVWEAAGEAHSFATDELSDKQGPGSPILIWGAHLDYWKRAMETSRLSRDYFGAAGRDDDRDSDDRFSPYTLLMWYVAALKMHAPIAILHSAANLRRRRLSPAPVGLRNYDLGARIRAWMDTPCSRRSCWYAAQIARVVHREAAAAVAVHATTRARARQMLLNPLASQGMFTAAVVASSYAYYVPVCTVCAGSPAATAGAMPVVDLFAADDEDDVRLQTWIQTGVGHAVWGPTHIPVCRCSFDGLAAWLRETLVGDSNLEQAFAAYAESCG